MRALLAYRVQVQSTPNSCAEKIDMYVYLHVDPLKKRM